MKSLWAVRDAAMYGVRGRSQPNLSVREEGLARHNGHRPKWRLFVRGQQITLRREEVR